MLFLHQPIFFLCLVKLMTRKRKRKNHSLKSQTINSAVLETFLCQKNFDTALPLSAETGDSFSK